MKHLFANVLGLLGVWLGVAPLVLNYGSTAAIVSGGATGAVILVASVTVFATETGTVLTWAWRAIAVAAAWAFLSGLHLFGAWYPNEIVFGAVGALAALVASQLPEGRRVSVYTKDGKSLMELNTMRYADGRIEMRGKTFGTMPATMYVQPVEVWNLVGMIPPDVIRRLPYLLWLGWRQTSGRQAGAKDATPEAGPLRR